MGLTPESKLNPDYNQAITIRNQFDEVLGASLEAYQARRISARLLLAALTSSPEETDTMVVDPETEVEVPHNILIVRRKIGITGSPEIEVQDPFASSGIEYPSITLGVYNNELTPASFKMYDEHSRPTDLRRSNQPIIPLAISVLEKFRRSQVIRSETP